MHRRVLVVDGRIGFAGGVGIAEQWTGNAEDPDHWRETHVKVEGPAVRDLLGAFLENWTEATGEILTGRHLPELAGFDHGVPVQVTRSSSSDASTATEQLFFATIVGARESLAITTAYFAPRRAFVDALCQSAERGVDVRVLVNGQPIDKHVVREAGQRSYGRLLEAGVRIFEYQRAMLHAKVLLVDDAWANVGTANMDNRSSSLNEELNLATVGHEMVAELGKHFQEDLDKSEELDIRRWKERPLHKRLSEYAGELVRPSL
ncbi:MAG: phospholipase D-like domain-containing protein [Actinomycetota bacterium]|nr:phospholipase D-like domain-containing protein [Actinomycetota bacterium]